MFDPTDKRFFETLAALCRSELGATDPTTEAAERACRSAAPEDLRAARLALDALPDEQRLRLLRQVHHRLASDLSAIWEQFPGPQKSTARH
ncbi:hypothetical protein M4578_21035 [Salipiger sp. P9]|uniref:hypothetical protein n=1 Tax=Salipiger pentaromativorans TaxID=2943193 RepID=UPI002158313F|nr:hypothetical protein [Salipiger pentaromativorans]MCR8550314.1 hypothetical protein [Salipiger pentaromativorans]